MKFMTVIWLMGSMAFAQVPSRSEVSMRDSYGPTPYFCDDFEREFLKESPTGLFDPFKNIHDFEYDMTNPSGWLHPYDREFQLDLVLSEELGLESRWLPQPEEIHSRYQTYRDLGHASPIKSRGRWKHDNHNFEMIFVPGSGNRYFFREKGLTPFAFTQKDGSCTPWKKRLKIPKNPTRSFCDSHDLYYIRGFGSLFPVISTLMITPQYSDSSPYSEGYILFRNLDSIQQRQLVNAVKMFDLEEFASIQHQAPDVIFQKYIDSYLSNDGSIWLKEVRSLEGGFDYYEWHFDDESGSAFMFLKNEIDPFAYSNRDSSCTQVLPVGPYQTFNRTNPKSYKNLSVGFGL